MVLSLDISLNQIASRRTAAFVVALIGMSISGTLYAFSAFEPAFKKTFNYDQSEVETISAMGNVGTSLGFPVGVFFNRYGPKWTAFLGLVVYSSGYMLMWMSVLLKDYFSTAYGWQGLFYFIVGQGSTITYMTCLMTTINNYPLRLRGTVVGFVDAMYGASAAIFAAIYASSFVNGHDNGDEEKQNLKGFFLMCSIVIVVANTLAIIFLKQLPLDDNTLIANTTDEDTHFKADEDTHFKADEDTHSKADDSVSTRQDKEDTDDAILGNIGGFPILINLDFQYLFWIANIGGGVGLTYMNNVSSILESFKLSKDNGFLSTLTPIASCLARVTAGFISDRLVHRVPRAVILLFWLVVLAVMQFISMFFLGSYPVLVLNSIVIGASFGSIWCLAPTIVSELFGTKNFGWNWGWMMLSTAIGTVVYQRVFAAIYQFYIRPGDGLTCYGLKCYRWTFLMTAVTAVYSIILTIALIQRINIALKRKKSRRDSIVSRSSIQINKNREPVV